jgi:hypothetical protein
MIVSSILENNKDEKRIIFSLDVIKKYTKSGITVYLPKIKIKLGTVAQ